MAYRNGTYVAFHAEGSSDPTASDIKYYRMMMAWHANEASSFNFYNSHEKVPAVRDTSQDATIKRSLRERLDNSKNMVLIIGQRTRFDTDFVPYEINYAAGTCGIPIIAVYPGQGVIRNPNGLSTLWPAALAERIANGRANVIHIPFHQKTIEAAVSQFSHNTLPTGGGLGFYNDDAYRSFGLI
jgi:MTH538 TIR-like domain (DUF1863)